MVQLSLVGPPAEPEKVRGRRGLMWKIRNAIVEDPRLQALPDSMVDAITEAVAERLHPHPMRKVGHRALLLALYGDKPKCWICGFAIPLDAEPDAPESFSIDHMVERSKGGAQLGFSNLAPSHRLCNILRSDARTRRRTRERYERFLETVAERAANG